MYKRPDSAFYYFNLVATAVPDSLQAALAYNYMGRIQLEAGDYFGGQESLTMSLRYLDTLNEKHRQCFSSDLNELGLSSVSLKQYDAAIAYFDRVHNFRDPDDELVLLNNKALAYQYKGAYPEALRILNEIIKRSPKPKTYARILTNQATVKALIDPRYPAAADLLKALTVRIREKDQWGQNSSYAHLSDLYRQRRPDSALWYARKMRATALAIESPDDELLALEKLITLDVPAASKRYFQRYHTLNDSLQTARNASKDQFALIRYEVERNKADKLALQKENTERRYQLIGGAAFVMIGITGAILWYRKRKRRIERAAREAIRAGQLKTSRKVHDVVANGLYRIMTELDHTSELDKTALADKIEELYERSRDISYEKEVPAYGHFHECTAALANSFANEQVKVVLVGNDAELWQGLGRTAEYELEQVLQELLVNMKKHSRATKVLLRFERSGEHIHILYTDNGVGIAGELTYKNGLTNTGNRMDSLHGTITFETNGQQGLKIHLNFPVA